MIPSNKQYFLILLPLALLGYWFLDWQAVVVVLGILLAGILHQPIRQRVFEGIHQVLTVIGRIQTAVLMSVIFFVVLLPSAMIYQWKRRSVPVDSKTAFRDRPHDYQSPDFEHPW